MPYTWRKPIRKLLGKPAAREEDWDMYDTMTVILLGTALVCVALALIIAIF